MRNATRLVLLLACALALVACDSANQPSLPGEARTALQRQLATTNMEILSAQQAPSPGKLQDTVEMWCVVTQVTPENTGAPLYGNYLMYRGANNWNVTIATSEQFLTVGCANFRNP